MSPFALRLLVTIVIGLMVGRAVRNMTPRLLRLHQPGPFLAGPWVELAGAALFALVEILGVAAPTRLGAFVFATLLLAVSVADLRAKLIPDLLTFSGVAIALVWNALRPAAIYTFLGQRELLPLLRLPRDLSPWSALLLAAGGALLGFLLLEGFRRLVGWLAGVEGMGMGDAKLLMMIGAFLGPHGVLLTLLPACAVGAVAGLVHRFRSGQPHVVFGPALAAGALFVLFAGESFLGLLWRASLALFALPRPLIAAFYGGLLTLLILVLLHLRRRAAEYEEIIEDDYRAIEDEMGDDS